MKKILLPGEQITIILPSGTEINIEAFQHVTDVNLIQYNKFNNKLYSVLSVQSCLYSEEMNSENAWKQTLPYENPRELVSQVEENYV